MEIEGSITFVVIFLLIVVTAVVTESAIVLTAFFTTEDDTVLAGSVTGRIIFSPKTPATVTAVVDILCKTFAFTVVAEVKTDSAIGLDILKIVAAKAVMEGSEILLCKNRLGVILSETD